MILKHLLLIGLTLKEYDSNCLRIDLFVHVTYQWMTSTNVACNSTVGDCSKIFMEVKQGSVDRLHLVRLLRYMVCFTIANNFSYEVSL